MLKGTEKMLVSSISASLTASKSYVVISIVLNESCTIRINLNEKLIISLIGVGYVDTKQHVRYDMRRTDTLILSRRRDRPEEAQQPTL